MTCRIEGRVGNHRPGGFELRLCSSSGNFAASVKVNASPRPSVPQPLALGVVGIARLIGTYRSLVTVECSRGPGLADEKTSPQRCSTAVGASLTAKNYRQIRSHWTEVVSLEVVPGLNSHAAVLVLVSRKVCESM